MSFDIYIAASYKQIHAVKLFNNAVHEINPAIEIRDWTNLPIISANKLHLADQQEWMKLNDHGDSIFNFCSSACVNCDLLIYFGESGQDAGVQVGMAFTANVPILGIRGSLESPGLMLTGCVDKWCVHIEDALVIIKDLATCYFNSELQIDRSWCEDNCSADKVCNFYRQGL